jgi:hypothetical protein
VTLELADDDTVRVEADWPAPAPGQETGLAQRVAFLLSCVGLPEMRRYLFPALHNATHAREPAVALQAVAALGGRMARLEGPVVAPLDVFASPHSYTGTR